MFFDPKIIEEFIFNFYVFVNFQVFLLLLISSFILLWSEKILGIIFIFLHLLSLLLWAHMRSIPDDVPCESERNMLCCCYIELVYLYIRFIWSGVLFKFTVSLVIFHLFVLQIIIEVEMLKCPIIIVLLFLSLAVSIFVFYVWRVSYWVPKYW